MPATALAAVPARWLARLGPVTFARAAGSSIAAPSAAGWVTDFLNAAYYAHPEDERELDDLRLAHSILTTRWHGLGRRLRLSDLPSFHRAFGAQRVHATRRSGSPRLDRPELLAGAGTLIGHWFEEAWRDPARRGWGIVFATAQEAEAYEPEGRLRNARMRELTPPRRLPAEQHWHTYRPVALPSAQAALAVLAQPRRWPDFAAEIGRFTPLRGRGLEGQTFEIEVVGSPTPRTPVFTRGYVTCTRLLIAEQDPAPTQAYFGEVAAQMASASHRAGGEALPPGAEPVAAVELTTHAGHFLGRGISRLLVFEVEGEAFIRDVGSWDPLPPHLALPYRAGGAAAQRAFWGDGLPRQSLLHQLAALAR